MNGPNGPKDVVIAGGGFVGLGWARRLASPKEVRVTLIPQG